MSIAIVLTKTDPTELSVIHPTTEVEDDTLSTPPMNNEAVSYWQRYFIQFSVIYNGVMAKK